MSRDLFRKLCDEDVDADLMDMGIAHTCKVVPNYSSSVIGVIFHHNDPVAQLKISAGELQFVRGFTFFHLVEPMQRCLMVPSDPTLGCYFSGHPHLPDIRVKDGINDIPLKYLVPMEIPVGPGEIGVNFYINLRKYKSIKERHKNVPITKIQRWWRKISLDPSTEVGRRAILGLVRSDHLLGKLPINTESVADKIIG